MYSTNESNSVYGNSQVIPLKGDSAEGIETLVNDLAATSEGQGMLKKLAVYALLTAAASGVAAPASAEERYTPLRDSVANVKYETTAKPSYFSQAATSSQTNSEEKKKSIWEKKKTYGIIGAIVGGGLLLNQLNDGKKRTDVHGGG